MDTPDTFFYFYLGYAVILGMMVIYLISLFLRWQRLKREEKRLSNSKD
ncbi:MAG TPA: hypothetical protein VMC62_02945 [Longilinea sp.]|nr:hypothetical protein [Longilinea sp.]